MAPKGWGSGSLMICYLVLEIIQCINVRTAVVCLCCYINTIIFNQVQCTARFLSLDVV